MASIILENPVVHIWVGSYVTLVVWMKYLIVSNGVTSEGHELLDIIILMMKVTQVAALIVSHLNSMR